MGTHSLFTFLFQALIALRLPLLFLSISPRYPRSPTEPTLSFSAFFFSSRPIYINISSLSRFPHRVHNSSGASWGSSPLLRPPRSRPSPRLCHPWDIILRMMQRSRWGVGSCDCGCWLLLGVAPLSLYYHFVSSRALSPLHPPLYSHPR